MNQLIENFVRYFLQFPNNTYMDFYNKIMSKTANDSFGSPQVRHQVTPQAIDRIRKELQRSSLLMCRRLNDASGKLYSNKNFDIEGINKKYKLEIHL